MDVIPVFHGADGPDDPISALADQIADRVALRLGMRFVDTTPVPAPFPPGLWTARQVAAHYDVGVSFVYQHADELGAIRLGGGRRPRLRFDPRVVRERWAIVGDALPATAKTRRRTRRTSGQRAGARRTYELIEYDES